MKRNILKNTYSHGAGWAFAAFTLIEGMIVVAIIAVLLALSIPFVSHSMETVRVRVDMANERGAIGLAEVNYLLEGKIVPDAEATP